MIDDSLLGHKRRGLRATSVMTLLVALVLSATFALSGGLLSGPLAAMAQADTSATSQTNSTVSSVAEKATKAVVTITNYSQGQGNQNGFPQDPNAPANPGNTNGNLVPVDEGSGYIIDNQGHIVTNNHVIAGGSAWQVEFYDGTTA